MTEEFNYNCDYEFAKELSEYLKLNLNFESLFILNYSRFIEIMMGNKIFYIGCWVQIGYGSNNHNKKYGMAYDTLPYDKSYASKWIDVSNPNCFEEIKKLICQFMDEYDNKKSMAIR